MTRTERILIALAALLLLGATAEARSLTAQRQTRLRAPKIVKPFAANRSYWNGRRPRVRPHGGIA